MLVLAPAVISPNVQITATKGCKTAISGCKAYFIIKKTLKMSTQIYGLFVPSIKIATAVALFFRAQALEKIAKYDIKKETHITPYFKRFGRGHLDYDLQIFPVGKRYFCRIVSREIESDFPYFRNLKYTEILAAYPGAKQISYDTRVQDSQPRYEKIADEINAVLQAESHLLIPVLNSYRVRKAARAWLEPL